MKLRDIVKITMNGKVKIPNSGLHEVYTMYLKNGESIKVISNITMNHVTHEPIIYYREANTDRLIFVDRWVQKNRNRKRISKMIDQAWKYYIYKTKGIDKIYNSKDEIMDNIRFKIVINTRRDAFKTIMNNEYIIQLVDLLNCKNYHVLEDYYGHIKFTIGTNGIVRKISLPKLVLDKDVKEINVQNFPFGIWKIKKLVLDSVYYRQTYIHDDIAYNLDIKDGILYNTDESGEVATYIELHICKDYILEKDCFKDIDEYTDYILDRYNSGAKKLYDWAASLE